MRTKKRSQGELSKTAGRAHEDRLGKFSALTHKLSTMSRKNATDTGRIDALRMRARSTRPRSMQCETANVSLLCSTSYATRLLEREHSHICEHHDVTRGMTFEKDKGKERKTAASGRLRFSISCCMRRISTSLITTYYHILLMPNTSRSCASFARPKLNLLCRSASGRYCLLTLLTCASNILQHPAPSCASQIHCTPAPASVPPES